MRPEQIINLRRRARLTQKQFAEALGVQQATISYWESGRHTPRDVQLAMLRRMEQQLAEWEAARRADRYEAAIKAALTLGLVGVLSFLFNDDEDDDE